MKFETQQIVNEDGQTAFRDLADAFRSSDGEKKQWIFRGMDKWDGCNVSIKSSFDEAWESAHGSGESDNRRLYESWMLMDFKREVHHYLNNLPKPKDFLEWMALARHYGMPSRLVDFSYYFHVAAYFALSKRRKCEDGCVLAVNLDWLKDPIAESLMKKWFGKTPKMFRKASFHDPIIFYRYAFKYGKRCVVPVSPMRRNIRLARQHGLFLCPADMSCSFEDNLEETVKQKRDRCDLIKVIRIPSKDRSEALRELDRMNIGLHTLYGDLTGWAESRRDLVHKEITDKRFVAELERAITDPLC